MMSILSLQKDMAEGRQGCVRLAVCLGLIVHSHELETGRASVSSSAKEIMTAPTLLGGFRERYKNYQHRVKEMVVLGGGNTSYFVLRTV